MHDITVISATPYKVPDLDKWPIIKKLHIPPSTKSFY